MRHFFNLSLVRKITRQIFPLLFLLTSSLILQAAPTPIEDLSSLPPILKKGEGERKTARFRLDNGLELFIISDPKATRSAAALSVRAGSWDNPIEAEGMAHFVEHMLFAGSSAYPEGEQEFKEYLSNHSGSSNAFTYSGYTCYAFAVSHDGFEGAIDRFSHFFIDPLFSPSSVYREKKIIEEEYRIRLETDNFLATRMLSLASNQEHPNARFANGNLASLDNVSEKSAKEWFQNYYVAEKMHLVILSPNPVEEIIEPIASRFSLIQNHPSPSNYHTEQLFSETYKGNLIYLKSVEEKKSLSCVWQLSSPLADIEHARGSMELITHLFRNEMKGSLSYILKEKKLIESIDVSYHSPSDESLLFEIDFSLTEEGANQPESILGALYLAIEEFRKQELPYYLFEERQRVSMASYQNHSATDDPFNEVVTTASSLIFQPIEIFPERSYIGNDYSPKLTEEILQELQPSSAIQIIFGNQTEIEPTHSDKWSGTLYAIRQLSESQIRSWKERASPLSLSIPPLNPYLFSDMISADPLFPTLLLKETLGSLYYKDCGGTLSALSLSLQTALADSSIRSRVLLDFYLTAVRKQLKGLLFFAESAEIRGRFGINNDGSLEFFFSGYNGQISHFFKDLIAEALQLSPDKDEFEHYKKTMLIYHKRALKNSLLYYTVFEKTTYSDLVAIVEAISYEDFVFFIQNLFKQIYARMVICGGMSDLNAEEIWKNFTSQINGTPFSIDSSTQMVSSLPKGKFLIEQKREEASNQFFSFTDLGRYSTDQQRIIQLLLSDPIQSEFFSAMRLRNQSTYAPKCNFFQKEGHLFLIFSAQSSCKDSYELLADSEFFIEEFRNNLAQHIPSERFHILKSDLLNYLSYLPTSDPLEAVHYFSKQKEMNRSQMERNKKLLKRLSYEDFISKATLLLSSERRVALVSQSAPFSPKASLDYQITTPEELLSLLLIDSSDQKE